MTPPVEMMVGRDAESGLIQATILAASSSIMFPATGYHVSGAPEIGKSQLVRHVRSALAAIDNVVCLGPDAEMMPYLGHPIDELIEVRNAMREAYPALDCEGFDLGAIAFMRRFKRAGQPQPVMPGAEIALVDVFQASFLDTVKKGFESSLGDLRVWAMKWTGSGGAAGGALKAGTMAKGTAIASSWAGVAAVAADAVTVGLATLATAAGGKVYYHLLKGIRLRVRRGRIRERFPELDGLIASRDRNYSKFFAYLAYMLADAISRAHDGDRGYVPVLFLDPGDDLADRHEGPWAQVGKAYASVLDQTVHKVVIASSRTALAPWHRGVRAGRTAPDVDYQPIVLTNIPLGDAEHWCRANSYVGEWPPTSLSTRADGTVAPKDLGDWWSSRGPGSPESEVA